MQALPSVGERLDQFNSALAILEANYPPSGIINPADGTPVQRVQDVMLSSLNYVEVATYCGVAEQPPIRPGAGQDWNALLSLGQLAERHGQVSPFGVTGWLLKNSLQQVFTEQGWVNDEGVIPYETDSGATKVFDSGLGSGCMAMAKMLEKVVTVTTPNSVEIIQQTAASSLAQIPVAFAKMPNAENKKLEVLYEIRRSGAYERADAAFDLEAGNPALYFFIHDHANGRVVPANWDIAHEAPFTSDNMCGAVKHPVFSGIWYHLIKATTAIEGLIPVSAAPNPAGSVADNLEQ